MTTFQPESHKERAQRLGYKSLSLQQAYLEDGLSGYTTGRSVKTLEREISDLLLAAGAEEVNLIYGTAESRKAIRLRFVWENVATEILQVALPIRVRKTTLKLEQSIKQALYHLLNEVRFELERRHFHPNSPAFVTYMIAKGGLTIGQLVAENAPLQLGRGEDE
jgi:hypothetical protein